MLALFLSLPAWAATYEVVATGRCIAEDGTPVPGAKVELLNGEKLRVVLNGKETVVA